jgi:parallel beta-helix repeat protein
MRAHASLSWSSARSEILVALAIAGVGATGCGWEALDPDGPRTARSPLGSEGSRPVPRPRPRADEAAGADCTVHPGGDRIEVPEDCASVQAAIDLANPGDTIEVSARAGGHAGFTVSKRLHLTGSGGPIVNAPSPYDPCCGIVIAPGASGSIVADFTVTGDFTEGILVVEADGVVVSGNLVRGDFFNGIRVVEADDVEVTNNTVERAQFGIVLAGTRRGSIADNTVRDMGENIPHAYAIGILLQSWPGVESAYNSIVDNLVVNESSGGYVNLGFGNGAGGGPFHHNVWRDNTVRVSGLTFMGSIGHFFHDFAAFSALAGQIRDNRVEDNDFTGSECGLGGFLMAQTYADNVYVDNVPADEYDCPPLEGDPGWPASEAEMVIERHAAASDLPRARSHAVADLAFERWAWR